LHLLATVAGRRELSPADTFQDVLEAPDLGAIVDWLRRRPLLHYDPHVKRVLVHAGIPPPWTVAEARAEARDVEAQLRGRQWRHALKEMYGGEPSVWSRKLRGADRRRFTINALTRMRYVDRRDRIDLSYSGAPGTQPKGLVPWFDVEDRRSARAHVVFGHWAALGLLRRSDVTALDTGCVWGNYLTAVRLDRPARPVKVSAATAKRWQRRRRPR
ncbi:MAG TPA: symmetrical bis(5'-nucleosyl)-tetraphosphatase, partial [Gammaproteobacteria bacterium]|nr:symmetrical bis(5'-nucleosyl)-tetraphosphatase [Gammaproteobacteria bacterium]